MSIYILLVPLFTLVWNIVKILIGKIRCRKTRLPDWYAFFCSWNSPMIIDYFLTIFAFRRCVSRKSVVLFCLGVAIKYLSTQMTTFQPSINALLCSLLFLLRFDIFIYLLPPHLLTPAYLRIKFLTKYARFLDFQEFTCCFFIIASCYDSLSLCQRNEKSQKREISEGYKKKTWISLSLSLSYVRMCLIFMLNYCIIDLKILRKHYELPQ